MNCGQAINRLSTYHYSNGSEKVSKNTISKREQRILAPRYIKQHGIGGIIKAWRLQHLVSAPLVRARNMDALRRTATLR